MFQSLCRKTQVLCTRRVREQWVRSFMVELQPVEQIVLVREKQDHNGPTMQFPGIWLRDNCLCDACFHRNSLSRLPHGWNNFDTKVKVQDLSVNVEQETLHINWSDAHRSEYPLEWLRERDFSSANRQRYLSHSYRPESQHWSGDQFQNILQKFEYRDLVSRDDTLAEWLRTLAIYGVALIKNSPLDIGVVKTLCNRVGFIRRTTYGEEFSVKSQPGAKNYSYLAEPLPLHTDMPYFEYKPSLTILHTLEQSVSQGGWNLLADAFYVADLLREKHPEEFEVLSRTRVDWADIGMDNGVSFHNIWRAPVINLDADGNYARINHSVPQRDSHFSIPVQRVQPWYEANALFVRLAQEQAVSFKTTPGDVLTFNNLRMVHGRTGYDDTELNVRHIVGGFVDWDIAYSRLRVLQKQQQQQQQQRLRQQQQLQGQKQVESKLLSQVQ
ncbi:gamma-butyrobetaine dioxygenase [Scaptodrosophila lebanonensis]|uniref:Gamma-butyrobetaine dioxygenase n=1 Tax=Drosophila lebanonensis TaxID=7225 RepID=A0A6J2UFD8_DROLE|nr:gamma-butyrobetaine dioxygenase [Scaptodrosophila lebanonensis]